MAHEKANLVCDDMCFVEGIPKSNFAVLTGTLEGTGSSSVTGTVNFPDGFTKDNCVLIGLMLKPSIVSNWMTGSVFNSGNSFGSLPARVVMDDTGLQIDARNIMITDGTNPSLVNIPNNFNYKIVLMKVS